MNQNNFCCVVSMKIYSIALLMIILIYITTINFNYIKAQESYSENLRIYQIYDKTIVTGIFSGKYVKALLPITLTHGLKYFSFSIAKFTPNTANAYWFINNNPEKESSDYLYWRGVYLNITYENSNYNPHDLIDWISNNFNIVFEKLASTSTSYVFYTGGNLELLSELLLNSTIDWGASGFLNLFRHNAINYIEYRFNNSMNTIIMTTVFHTPRSMLPQKSNMVSLLNYTKIFNETISTSALSDDSLITFNLYGISVNKSDISYITNAKWFSGPNNHWITTGIFRFPSGVTIQKMNIYVTLFNQPLIFSITTNKSHLLDNDVLSITINVTNPNPVSINNVSINLILPEAFKEAPSLDVTVGNIKPSSSLSQSVSLHYTHSEQKILRIRFMYSYADGLTLVQGYANDIIISTLESRFPLITYYIKSLTNTSFIDGSSSVTYNVTVQNIGDANATKVKIHIGAYYIDLGQLNEGKSITYRISYDPKNITFASLIPKGAEASPPIYVTFIYENNTYSLLSNSTLPSLSKTFSNYAILIGTYTPKSLMFTSQYTVEWNIVNIGAAKSVVMILDKSKFSTIGLVHGKNDDFNETSKYLITRKTISFNQSIVISLSLYATRNDTFILPPLFENITGLPLIMMEPAIFTNAIYVTKNVDKLSLNMNDNLLVTLSIQNLGSKPIFSVLINDTIPAGWGLVEGSSVIKLQKLNSSSAYTLKYIIKAIDPQSQVLPSGDVTFSINNIRLRVVSNKIVIYVRLMVNMNVVTWNDLPVQSGTLIIKDLFSNNSTALPIQDGKTTWYGYVGTFNVQVIYRNITVYNSSLKLTSNSSTLVIKTAIYPFTIKTVDILNNPINSRIYIYFNKTLFEQGNNSVTAFLPVGSYSIVIQYNEKILTIPLDVSGPSMEPVNIRFNTITIGGLQIDLSILILLVTLIFILAMIYILFKVIT